MSACDGRRSIHAARPRSWSYLTTSATPAQRVRATFRVSDAVRRRKVGGARTRGPRAVIYGELDSGPTGASAASADKRTDVRVDRRLIG